MNTYYKQLRVYHRSLHGLDGIDMVREAILLREYLNLNGKTESKNNAVERALCCDFKESINTEFADHANYQYYTSILH
jgi:hypothetical protein